MDIDLLENVCVSSTCHFFHVHGVIFLQHQPLPKRHRSPPIRLVPLLRMQSQMHHASWPKPWPKQSINPSINESIQKTSF